MGEQFRLPLGKQDLGDSLEADSLAQHLAGSRMPEDMRAALRGLDTGSLQGRMGDMADPFAGLAYAERLKGGDRAQENELVLYPGSSDSHVLEQGITHILW